MIDGWTARLRLLRWQERLKLLPVLISERRDSKPPQGSRWVWCYHGRLPCAAQDMEAVRSRLVLASKVRPAQPSGLLFLRLAQRAQ
jgi:hypothetical protein